MLWIALAAAAQLSAPVPTNLGKWFSYEDVPSYLLEKESGLWLVGVRINVASDGTVQNCAAEKSSGVADLDKLTCAIVLRRAKFSPARSIDGSVSSGVYRDSVQWSVGDAAADRLSISNPDLDIFVQSLPSKEKSPTLVRVMFAVDETGSKSSCMAEPSPAFEKTSNNPALVSVACEQVMNGYNATPAKDGSGKAVASVQDALVRFSVKRQ